MLLCGLCVVAGKKALILARDDRHSSRISPRGRRSRTGTVRIAPAPDSYTSAFRNFSAAASGLMVFTKRPEPSSKPVGMLVRGQISMCQ